MATKRTSVKPSTKKATSRKTAGKAARPTTKTVNRWSKRVMETSDALDLERSIFKSRNPRKIALSLKRSAEQSHRRKAEPFQSAMSMLNFYINRGGKNLSASQTKVLESAKDELRKAFGREEEGQKHA